MSDVRCQMSDTVKYTIIVACLCNMLIYCRSLDQTRILNISILNYINTLYSRTRIFTVYIRI